MGTLRQRFGKLTSTQKICAVLLGGSLVIVVAAAFFLGSSGTYQNLVSGPPVKLHRLLELLDRDDVLWTSHPLPDGDLQVKVFAGDDYRRAVKIAGANGFGPGTISRRLDIDASGLSGLVRDPEKLRIREEETKRRYVEESVAMNPNIHTVRVMVNRSPQGMFDKKPGKGTAGVSLQLKPQLERLSDRETGSIRHLVHGALGIPLDDIQIVDQHGNQYNSRSFEARDAEDLRRKIRHVVEGFYLGPYEAWEFRVGVMTHVSSQNRKEEEIHVDRDKSFSLPRRTERQSGEGERPGSVTIEEEPHVSKTKTTTTIPAGEVLGIGVTVSLDKQAVRRVLEKEDQISGLSEKKSPVRGLDRRIRAYERQQVEILAKQIPYPNVTVEVSATAFSGATPYVTDSAAVAATGKKAAPWTRSAAFFFAVTSVPIVVLVCFLVYRRRRRRDEPRGDVSAAETDAVPQNLTPCQETLELALEAAQVVRDRPDVAASILRLWVTEDRSVGGAGDVGETGGDGNGTGKEHDVEASKAESKQPAVGSPL